MQQPFVLAATLAFGVFCTLNLTPNPKLSSQHWLDRLVELRDGLDSEFDSKCPNVPMAKMGCDDETRRYLLSQLEAFERHTDYYLTLLSPEERSIANRRLAKLEFEAPSELSKEDLRQILQYFLTHPVLDPRIVEITIIDSYNLEIRVGEWNGGEIHKARRKNGKWEIRLGTTFWMS